MERRRDVRTQGAGESQASESAAPGAAGWGEPQEAWRGARSEGRGCPPLLWGSACAAGLSAPRPAVPAVLESGLRC